MAFIMKLGIIAAMALITSRALATPSLLINHISCPPWDIYVTGSMRYIRTRHSRSGLASATYRRKRISKQRKVTDVKEGKIRRSNVLLQMTDRSKRWRTKFANRCTWSKKGWLPNKHARIVGPPDPCSQPFRSAHYGCLLSAYRYGTISSFQTISRIAVSLQNNLTSVSSKPSYISRSDPSPVQRPTGSLLAWPR